MVNKLFYNTVSPLLHDVLKTLMNANELVQFRLVGGTALSLYRGHRLSIDIDLFTDAKYGSIDYNAIDKYLRNTFNYVDTSNENIIGFGKSYFVGNDAENIIKLDIFYSNEAFLFPESIIDELRIAEVSEIVAMKTDVVSRGGRKKDFWDLHELMNDYTINEMFKLHKQRHPFTHDKAILKENFCSFTNADLDFDPVCLKGKHWELIKLDMIDLVKELT
ncbi:MAG: nucleotidyl transferase AbiEii/AbiGii toxin family protein [Bacteroidetes bacterium]|nr:nucleotidyl transferase AbiEii/AbiGii toxin family protein [Bacteroidota bacterium]